MYVYVVAYVYDDGACFHALIMSVYTYFFIIAFLLYRTDRQVKFHMHKFQ